MDAKIAAARAAIAELPPAQQAVIGLRDVEGLSTAETSAALELSEAAVKSRLHRARRLFRKEWSA